MIPADHISFNDDGTAWWVPEQLTNTHGPVFKLGANTYTKVMLDRRCRTCDGDQNVPVGPNGIAMRWEPGPDCTTGRHTFTVEVEQRTTMPGRALATTISRECAIRVSVVPDMVLPITSEVTDNASVQIAPDGTAFLLDAYTPGQPWTGGSRITLPPAAKPGMWAVKLKVHQ